MTCKYRVAKEEERDPTYDRVIEAIELDGGVSIRVNGVTVGRFIDGANHLEVYCPQTDRTGLVPNADGYLLTK